ncbi:ECF transporter S component [Clostridium sp. ZS2-4]|uniref:ECF transporter S component n=1 Tax=Clostridium sp. ZS2-4 TaxID=2987703 RepID=UPI00227C495E|nr:ECF transporter S component [Clostridium sp. ZS2-4]MCY6356329.1 ECF transporter S component [Clostridium sp. ZS2-4]
MKQSITSNQMSQSKTIELTQMALMTAIICVATMVIKIPTVMGIGYDHLGDSMVFFAAILFGKKKGMITAALGMSLADLLSGYVYYVPFTFVIKGIMALIAASIAYRGNYEGKNIINNIFAFVVAGAWMVFGYFVAKIILVKFILFKADSFQQALALGLAGIPNNIGQVTVGMVIAIPLIKVLQGKLKIRRE